ncbi:hypothetical protein [Convivina praedatoris]|uniref:RiboL-PSP-HEPN domain-containing protein n=1 Tax=Convivina praedatoris TaxID=2880963 RepID=A0ABN8HAR3_9LACO|nr:hypothetical protein [Convivina sp. LMG 32447]CAH1855888.1 hypothetical protein R077815_01300 [Convivina sp. LMG 32447]CAH1856623.1 hypothetical protein LMG032447_01330 [Convivina sp. LMG 32447]CAH1856852.1 hypothetical protein R078138_01453 [Convivina sp. LMG 32447]
MAEKIADELFSAQLELIVIKCATLIETKIKKMINITISENINRSFIKEHIKSVVIDSRGKNVHMQYIVELLTKTFHIFDDATMIKDNINTFVSKSGYLRSYNYADFNLALNTIRNNRNHVAHKGIIDPGTNITTIFQSYYRSIIFIDSLESVLANRMSVI